MIDTVGVFEIKPEKKAPAEVKTAKHLGMIAGGTGKNFFCFFVLSLNTTGFEYSAI